MKTTLHRIILAATAVAATCISSAQPRLDAAPAPETPEAPRRQSSAWTLTYPLGGHEPSTVDTLLYNYQKRSIPSMESDAYATTGNLGAEGINMIFSQRHEGSPFFFDDALSAWLPAFRNQKFYNVYIPMTILSYNFGGNKQNHQDRLQATFAGNVNRRIGIGAMMDYLYSKGAYEAQATKDFSWGASGYYNGDRYEMQAFYQHFNFLNKENGGITDDLYISDPAVLQGGVDRIDAKSIPTRLTDAHNRINGDLLFMTHALKVGFWRDQQVNDTLTRQIYIPVMRFLYSFDYSSRHRFFINTNSQQGEEFWENRYIDPTRTEENFRYWQVTNTLGMEMIEGFQKWAKFGISAYASLQNRRYTLPTYDWHPELTEEQAAALTPLPEGFAVDPRTTQTLLWVGGNIRKEQGSLLRYRADARFGLVGDVAGDLELSGRIATRFKLFGDTVEIAADAHFSNLKPSWLLRHYVSNHFAWNNDFGKTRRVGFGGRLLIPWTRTTLSAEVENIQNYVYFNDRSLPTQHGGNVQVVTAAIDQKLRFGIWNWDNRVTFQTSTDSKVIPLPKLAIYSNMYLNFKAFRVLTLQMGVDCNYYTRYRGLDYQAATMSFHVQGPDGIDVGNYAFANVYATAKLYKVRFYVLWSHVNQGWFSKNYFSLPHYPVNPRRLQFGLSVDFAN